MTDDDHNDAADWERFELEREMAAWGEPETTTPRQRLLARIGLGVLILAITAVAIGHLLR